MNRPHSLIIGGTRGIGRALVRMLANEGHIVSVIGKRAPAESDAQRPDVDYMIADISDEERLPAVLSGVILQRGALTNLVFLQRYRGAGDPWVGEIATTLTATRSVIEILKDSFGAGGDNSIVVVSSVADHLIADEQPLGYHVAKAGLVQLVRYYALALGPRGIRVNAVSLGTVLKEESKQFYADHQALSDLYKEITPLRRIGTAEEMSQVISFLCSPKASFMTGQNLVVDGGMSLQWHESLARRLAHLDNLKVTRSATDG